MNNIRCIVVDDEPLARVGVTHLLESDREVAVVGTAADGGTALAMIRNLRPDVVFLDVQMPVYDGFEVLSRLGTEALPHVVFTTAYDRHAIRAFDVSAVDYLLKPFSDARFFEALGKAKSAVRQRTAGQLTNQVAQLLELAKKLELSSDVVPSSTHPTVSGSDSADRIVLKADGAHHLIKAGEVIWIEAQGDLVKVQTVAKTHLGRETLQSLEKKLDPAKFLRIHRSFLVNLEHVKRVETALYGDYSVYMSDGTKLRLSRSYRSKLKLLLAAKLSV